MSAQQFVTAVEREEIASLVKLPGVGKIFPHHKLGEDNRFLVDVRQLVKAGHWQVHFVTHTVRLNRS
jgi:Holliday junction resolvasome RuvABC DNA-binding subunit